MASQCIIHIAMHKTGSSSIQQSLSGYIDEAFSYARIGELANQSVPMFCLFSDQPENHPFQRSAGSDLAAVERYLEGVRCDLDRALQQSKGKTLCISGEDIASLSPTGVDTLRDFFRVRSVPLLVVAYVRSPAAYTSSAFSGARMLAAVQPREKMVDTLA